MDTQDDENCAGEYRHGPVIRLDEAEQRRHAEENRRYMELQLRDTALQRALQAKSTFERPEQTIQRADEFLKFLKSEATPSQSPAGASTRLVQIREPELNEARQLITEAVEHGTGPNELRRIKEILDGVAAEEAAIRSAPAEAVQS